QPCALSHEVTPSSRPPVPRIAGTGGASFYAAFCATFFRHLLYAAIFGAPPSTWILLVKAGKNDRDQLATEATSCPAESSTSWSSAPTVGTRRRWPAESS